MHQCDVISVTQTTFKLLNEGISHEYSGFDTNIEKTVQKTSEENTEFLFNKSFDMNIYFSQILNGPALSSQS